MTDGCADRGSRNAIRSLVDLARSWWVTLTCGRVRRQVPSARRCGTRRSRTQRSRPNRMRKSPVGMVIVPRASGLTLGLVRGSVIGPLPGSRSQATCPGAGPSCGSGVEGSAEREHPQPNFSTLLIVVAVTDRVDYVAAARRDLIAEKFRQGRLIQSYRTAARPGP